MLIVVSELWLLFYLLLRLWLDWQINNKKYQIFGNPQPLCNIQKEKYVYMHFYLVWLLDSLISIWVKCLQFAELKHFDFIW